MTNEHLTILGSFLSILLMVNAFFFKDMVKSLKNIELELMKLSTQHDNVSSDVGYLKKDIASMKEKIHRLEGAEAQILHFVGNIEKGLNK